MASQNIQFIHLDILNITDTFNYIWYHKMTVMWYIGKLFLNKSYNLSVSVLTLLDNTLHKWITSEAWWTYACYSMADNLALCICSTWAWARITTLVVHTCLLTWTVRIDNTFRPAVGWYTYISIQTWTCWTGPRNLALSIWSTRIWYTWILRNYRQCWRC